MNAITQFAQILTSHNRVHEAVPLIEHAGRLLGTRGTADGPALLRELVGGAPPAVTARVKIVR